MLSWKHRILEKKGNLNFISMRKPEQTNSLLFIVTLNLNPVKKKIKINETKPKFDFYSYLLANRKQEEIFPIKSIREYDLDGYEIELRCKNIEDEFYLR